MFGVTHVYVDWGGSGYYEGGVSRTMRFWWDGSDWKDKPIQRGPFESREAAQAFVDAQPDKGQKGVHIYVYAEGDPYGERPSN